MDFNSTFSIKRGCLWLFVNHVSVEHPKLIENHIESLKTLIHDSEIIFHPKEEFLEFYGVFPNHIIISFNFDNKSKIFTSSAVIEKTNYFIVGFAINSHLRLDFLHDTTALLPTTKKQIIKEYSLKRDLVVFNSKS